MLFQCVSSLCRCVVQNHFGNYESCRPDQQVYANMSTFNKARWYNITTNPGFVGGTGHPSGISDFALLPTSRLYTINPKFKSCPRSAVGPTVIDPGTILPVYLQYYNVTRPARFNDMLSFPFSQILNGKLTVNITDFVISNETIVVPS